MEEEDIDTRLTLRVGGGGGGQSGGQRRPPVQPDVFPPQVKEEMGSHTATHDHHQESPVRKKVEKGARKKIKIDGDGNCTDGRSASCGARKKLRLTKEQSARLEACFQAHNILSQAQKQELAPQLSLSERQVEVWFQNRRARTKLKQTEVECEQLRRCCDRLSEENCRLKQELEGLKRELQFYVRLPTVAPAAVRVCPSCENATAVARGG